MEELRPETWAPGVAPLVSPGPSVASALSEDKEACPAHYKVCDKEQMDVKMYLITPTSHHRVSPPPLSAFGAG